MSDANPARLGSPLPFAFTLLNADSEAVFNTLGDPQTFELQVTNTSRRVLKINKNQPQTFSLGFAAGLLRAPENIKIAKGSTGWKLDPEIVQEYNKIFLTFSLTRGRNLKPGQSISVKLSGIKANGSERSHGTIVALRYQGIDPTGADGLLKGFVSHHMVVVHSFPSELWRLGQQSRRAVDLHGRIAPADGMESVIARLHDEITPPLIVEGGGLVGPGATKLHLTLRANPKIFGHLEPSGRKPVVLGAGGFLAVGTLDADLSLEGALNVTASETEWISTPSKQDKSDEVQASPRSDCELNVGKDALHLSVALSASGAPRRSSVTLRCEGVTMNTIPYDAFSLSVPLLIGPITGEADTLAVHGDIALAKGGVVEGDARYPERVFSHEGVNVTLTEDEAAAFRVGTAKENKIEELTHFAVDVAGAVFGGFKKWVARHTVLKLRTGWNDKVGFELQQGRENRGFAIEVRAASDDGARKSGLAVRRLGETYHSSGLRTENTPALFVSDGATRVGIGHDDPKSTLHVAGSIMDRTGYVMPSGAIIMWNGSWGNETPQGWIVCDGKERFCDRQGNVKEKRSDFGGDSSVYSITPPDLRDRFIVGAGNNYALHKKNEPWGDTGRSDTSMTLKESHVPAHKHTGRIGKETNGALTQKYPFVTNIVYHAHSMSGTGYSVDDITSVDKSLDLTDVPITIHKGPNRDATSFDIRPQYCALFFIMKL